jgi:1-acyl-sn-glycerol-3-phosphate acyltransferase
MLRSLLQKLYGLYAAAMFVVVVLLILCPLLIIAPTLPLRRTLGRLAVRVWAAASFLPFRIRGHAHIPDGTCIAICNHASYLDGILLTAALPSRFTFLVQHKAGEWPYVGLVIRRMGVRLVNRESARVAAQAARDLLDRVRDGESFAIFPEGTFRRAPELLPFQAGAFVIAARAGVPVLPCVVRGSRQVFGEGRKMLRWHPIDIQFLTPLPSTADNSREAAHALRDAARDIILRHTGDADGLDRDTSASSAGA